LRRALLCDRADANLFSLQPLRFASADTESCLDRLSKRNAGHGGGARKLEFAPADNRDVARSFAEIDERDRFHLKRQNRTERVRAREGRHLDEFRQHSDFMQSVDIVVNALVLDRDKEYLGRARGALCFGFRNLNDLESERALIERERNERFRFVAHHLRQLVPRLAGNPYGSNNGGLTGNRDRHLLRLDLVAGEKFPQRRDNGGLRKDVGVFSVNILNGR
jgi:hypothetical protein